MPEIKNALSPGEIVGTYQILGIAGAGGMGVVYKAFDEKLERAVALKFLPPSLISSTSEKDRFLKEARAASSLDHPNVGIIHGVDETPDGRSYIVMAFYDGESLAKEIREGPIPCKRAIDIALQMANGLDHAHRHKIIHRDIKPSNVMVTPDGVVKIVDFGLARFVKSEFDTESGGTAGTVGYMSPEQSVGKPSDQRSDIWAWGIVLVEMLTGHNPFWRESIPATVDAILREAPRGIDQVPTLLQPIVYHALAKDPHSRYQACSDVIQDLESAKSEINSPIDEIDLSAPTRSISPNRFKNYVSAAAGPMVSHASHKRTVKGWFVASVIALVLISGLFFRKSLGEHFRNTFFTEPQKHIAVLPFDNIGKDPANEPLVEGLMDSLAGKLSNLGVGQQSLWVVPASEVRRLQVKDPSAALREFGATLAVKGSIQRDGQDVRLTVNLIGTKDMRQIGSASVEDRVGDLATLQDEAVARLAALMNISVTEDMLRDRGGAATPAAYEDYLKALAFMQRYDKPGNLDSAISVLNSAVTTDPRFSLGYAQLGEAYRLKYQLDKNPKWIEEALANCRKAAELNDRLPAVYVTLGRLNDLNGKHDLALQEFQHALELNPRDPDALAGLGRAYEHAGRIADAEAAYKKAAALRPDYWDGYNNLGNFLDRHQKYQEAIGAYRQAIELTPDNAEVYMNLGNTYLDLGDPKMIADAEKALKKSVELSPSYDGYANLGSLYLTEKRYSESATATEKALQFNGFDFRVWLNLASAYDWLQQKDKAAQARENALKLAGNASKAEPTDAQIQSALAMLYARKNMRDKSLVRIRAALALNPDDAQVLVDVAQAYEELGDRPTALKYVRNALQKGLSLEDLRSDWDLQNLLSDPAFRPPGSQ